MGLIRGIEEMPPRKERYEVLTDDVVETADVCVIGSGAGGAVAAHALAKAGKSVVLLERGGYYEGRDMNQRDMDMVPLLWKDGGMNFDDALTIAIAQGACLGGSTVINDAVCFDPPERVRAEWRALGVNFSDEEWAEHLARVRSMIHVGRVTEEELNRNNRMLRAGAKRLGLRDHWENERNCVNCMQCGFCHNGCHYDTKQNMLVTYLHDALAGPGDLRIYCSCQAEQLLTGGGRVEGVEGRFLDADGHERFRIRVNARAVVVSAGAIASSFLLLRNRIASATAGRGVVLHPSVLMVGLFPYEIKPNQGIPMAYSVHDFGVNRRQEISRTEYGCADGEFMIESIALPLLEFSMGMPGGPLKHHEFLAKFNHLAIAGMMARDQSRGRVSIASDDRQSFVYEVGPADRKSLAKASEIVGKMWFALGAERLATRHPAVPFVNRPEDLPVLTDAILNHADRMKLAAAHPQSGNAIGADPARSTVDGDCRVHGLSNLVVADASVFPNAVGVNPQVTVMVVASIAAARMVRDWDARYAAQPVSASTGRTGTLDAPMHFGREALARAIETAPHARAISALLTADNGTPTAPSWSIDPATLEITNDATWHGFFARDEKLPPETSPLGAGFFHRFHAEGDKVQGTCYAVGAKDPTPIVAEEHVAPLVGKCLLVEYPEAPHRKFTEVLKVIDDRRILGRLFEGRPDGGRRVFDFVLARRYPFEFLTAEDHERLFERTSAPDRATLPGVWEGYLAGDGGRSAVLFHYRYRGDGKNLLNDFRLGKKVHGSAAVATDERGTGTRPAAIGFWDELRAVNADWMIGKLHAPKDQLKEWVPSEGEWATHGADVDTVRIVLHRIADPPAVKD